MQIGEVERQLKKVQLQLAKAKGQQLVSLEGCAAVLCCAGWWGAVRIGGAPVCHQRAEGSRWL